MRGVVAPLVLPALVLVSSPSFAQRQCACPGQLVDHFPPGQPTGGDGAPLSWMFEDYLVQSETATSLPEYLLPQASNQCIGRRCLWRAMARCRLQAGSHPPRSDATNVP